VARFAADCAALAAAFERSPTPFLTAYPNQAWPVDSTVAVAALRLHDTLGPARFAQTIDRWLQAARQRRDAATGLLPHRADPLLHASEGFGLPVSWGGAKRYLFGVVPIGDAFLVWSKAARPWIAPSKTSELPAVVRW
jgi:hypothetical protein